MHNVMHNICDAYLGCRRAYTETRLDTVNASAQLQSETLPRV